MTRTSTGTPGNRLRLALAAAALSAAAASILLAQQRVGSGHALDGSLEVGTYGYNGYTGGSAPLAARNYAPYRGTSRQYVYQGEVASSAYRQRDAITPYDTYMSDRQYSPVWSSGMNSYSGQGGGNQGLRINYRVGG